MLTAVAGYFVQESSTNLAAPAQTVDCNRDTKTGRHDSMPEREEPVQFARKGM